MALDKINLADLALTLEKSPDYRVLRRLVPRTEFIPGNEQPTKTGILLDVETTGLDTREMKSSNWVWSSSPTCPMAA
jgi:hypothetical protein